MRRRSFLARLAAVVAIVAPPSPIRGKHLQTIIEDDIGYVPRTGETFCVQDLQRIVPDMMGEIARHNPSDAPLAVLMRAAQRPDET